MKQETKKNYFAFNLYKNKTRKLSDHNIFKEEDAKANHEFQKL